MRVGDCNSQRFKTNFVFNKHETFKGEFVSLINLKHQNKIWQPQVCLGKYPLALIQFSVNMHIR